MRGRSGGYLAGLVAAALGFVASAGLSVIWVLSQSPSWAVVMPTGSWTVVTRTGLFQFVLVTAGSVILTTYALSLAITDIVLKALRVRGSPAYALLALTLAGALLVVPLMLFNPNSNPAYYSALVLPGAAIGGAVLGHFRRG
jgi:hypothetical protein